MRTSPAPSPRHFIPGGPARRIKHLGFGFLLRHPVGCRAGSSGGRRVRRAAGQPSEQQSAYEPPVDAPNAGHGLEPEQPRLESGDVYQGFNYKQA